MSNTNYSQTPKPDSSFNFSNALRKKEYGVVPQVSPGTAYRSQYLNDGGGLAATAASSPTPQSTDPRWSYRKGYNDAGADLIDNPESSGPGGPPETAYRSGPSEKVANITAIGGLGLGALSFLENRKTADLQRKALRQDIATTKEHRANRKALGASFSAGLKSGLGGGNA